MCPSLLPTLRQAVLSGITLSKGYVSTKVVLLFPALIRYTGLPVDSAYWMVYEADGKGAKLFKTLCRYNNKAFLEGLRFRLFKLFPEKSKYER